jgi:hypothetical protein
MTETNYEYKRKENMSKLYHDDECFNAYSLHTYGVSALIYCVLRRMCDPFSMSAPVLQATLQGDMYPYENTSRSSLHVSAVLWCNIWVMNLR